jgi:hypothetical protein
VFALTRDRRAFSVMAIALVGDHVVCDPCVVAESFTARLRGLLGRRALPAREGMLIRRESSVHTFFMRFAIDVVFLDADERVLRIDATSDRGGSRRAAGRARCSSSRPANPPGSPSATGSSCAMRPELVRPAAALVGAAACLAASVQLAGGRLVSAVLLLATLAVLAAIDLEQRRIPNAIVLPAAAADARASDRAQRPNVRSSGRSRLSARPGCCSSSRSSTRAASGWET